MLRLSKRSDVTEIRKQTCISHKVSSSKSFYLTRSLLLRDLNAHVGNNNMIWMGVIGRKVKSFSQGCNEVRWRPGHEASLAPPCSTLRSFGSKCTVLKKVLMTLLGLFGAPRSDSAPGELFPLAPLVTPLVSVLSCSINKQNSDWIQKCREYGTVQNVNSNGLRETYSGRSVSARTQRNIDNFARRMQVYLQRYGDHLEHILEWTWLSCEETSMTETLGNDCSTQTEV